MARNRICELLAATALAAVFAMPAHGTPLPRPRPSASPAVNNKPPADVPLPRKRASASRAAVSAFAQASVGLRGGLTRASATFKPMMRPTSGPFALASSNATSAADVAAVKNVLEYTRKGKEADAETAAKSISDPVARTLAEWMILRSDNTRPAFHRYAAFIAANPAWPHVPLFRRRAENALWNDKLDDATVRNFFAQHQPTTAKGRLVLARALLAQGNRAQAEALVREAWQHDDFSADVERIALEMFRELITPADEKVRMDQRLYVGDSGSALRAAERLGGNNVAIAKASIAVTGKASNAKALLDAVPAAARRDPLYLFSRIEWMRRHDQVADAGKLLLTVPNDPAALVDLDQWWQQRRLLVRKLLDEGDFKTAYRIANDSPSPPKGNYRVDRHFTAGWIALRYLHDPATAARHFAHIPEGTVNPHALSRAGYWQGRAAEAMGQKAQARSFYETAARHSATYYGQLARARLGLPDLGLHAPPHFTPEEYNALTKLEVVRAVEILYTLNERDLVAPIFAELGESATDVAGMAMMAEIAERHNDGRAMLLLGKAAHSRGLPLDFYAYPTVGMPEYKAIAPPIEKSVVYSIARQESHFNQKVVSHAHAMGLMQVTPAAGIDTAKKFKVAYSKERLLSDPVYNVQMGAAELSNLIHGYRGSYLLTFAGYNAGRGRVRQWIAAYGDPREPDVDPIDWVERIPISETRNYVQRIMENLQVYRARFGGGSKLLIEADIRRDTGH
jgi:soluble lytic murein transglycosylase